jgi:hypothetical protein
MKKITISILAASLICALLMTPAAFAWEVYLHDDLGFEYRLNKLPNPIGQNAVYKGQVAHSGVEDQDCVAFWNATWRALTIVGLEDDYYYGITLNGYWGVAGGFIGTLTSGAYATGLNVYFGPLAPESGGGDGGDAFNAK